MAHIFLLAGPPAVGKSTTARALAARFDKSIHISVDTLRDMVISGLALPGGEWHKNLIEQLSLARECAAYMALTYSGAGFCVVLDDFWDPSSRLSEYSHLFHRSLVHRVLLYPDRQAAEQRNRMRDGSPYIEQGIRMVYEQLGGEIDRLRREGWWIVNSSTSSVEQTVQHILAQVA